MFFLLNLLAYILSFPNLKYERHTLLCNVKCSKHDGYDTKIDFRFSISVWCFTNASRELSITIHRKWIRLDRYNPSRLV